jgi:hypothetical protein
VVGLRLWRKCYWAVADLFRFCCHMHIFLWLLGVASWAYSIMRWGWWSRGHLRLVGWVSRRQVLRCAGWVLACLGVGFHRGGGIRRVGFGFLSRGLVDFECGGIPCFALFLWLVPLLGRFSWGVVGLSLSRCCQLELGPAMSAVTIGVVGFGRCCCCCLFAAVVGFPDLATLSGCR